MQSQKNSIPTGQLWTAEQDAQLVKMRNIEGRTFISISEQLNRSNKACAQRYQTISNRPVKPVSSFAGTRKCKLCGKKFKSPDTRKTVFCSRCKRSPVYKNYDSELVGDGSYHTSARGGA